MCGSKKPKTQAPPAPPPVYVPPPLPRLETEKPEATDAGGTLKGRAALRIDRTQPSGGSTGLSIPS
jgi:hypothetical protein